MVKSIWCEDVTIPAEMKAGSRLTYTYISGGSYPDYNFSEVSSFIAVAEQSDMLRCRRVPLLHSVQRDGHRFAAHLKSRSRPYP